MATLPFQEEYAQPPHIAVAHAILALFRAGADVDRDRLRRLFEAETGRSDASGGWSMRQAYDALELAQTLFLLGSDCPLIGGTAAEILAKLGAFCERLPVQAYRSEEQVALQQFSTPLPLAYLAGLAACPAGAVPSSIDWNATNGIGPIRSSAYPPFARSGAIARSPSAWSAPHHATVTIASRCPCSSDGNGSAGGAVASVTNVVSSSGASAISSRAARSASRARSHG